jgi:SdpC family antimicrobial peptide
MNAKNKIITVATAAALAVVLPSTAAVATGWAPTSSTSTTEQSTESTDGRELFGALYFGTGALAAELEGELDDASYTAFRDSVAEQGTDLTAIDTILDDLQASDAAYFDDFAREMTSGDVLRVEAAFSASAGDLAASVDEASVVDASAAERKADPGMANPQAAVPVFAVWVAVVSAAGAVHALTAAVQMNVAWTQNAFWSANVTSGEALSTEKGVVSLTASLSAY